MLPISKDGKAWLTEISHAVSCTSFLSNDALQFYVKISKVVTMTLPKIMIIKSPCKILGTNKWLERMLHIQHKNPNNEVLYRIEHIMLKHTTFSNGYNMHH